MSYLLIAVVLTAGTAFLIWLGDQITQFGVGNGISLIIFAGILSTLPSSLEQFAQSVFVGQDDTSLAAENTRIDCSLDFTNSRRNICS